MASRFMASGVTATQRQNALRQLMKENDIVRVMETHSGLTGLIAENARGPNGEEFHATWSSSLTSSTIRGKPDIETVDTTARIQIVEEILEVTTKPMIYDGDTGGHPEVFHFTVRTLERLGVSAVIIEDKTGLKQNSLFGTERKQQLEDIDSFCEKIKAGKAAQVTDDFMVIARMESLIAGWGEEEALMRAQKCIEAGADGIMIHSKEKTPDEVLSFIEKFHQLPKTVPLVAVPTTYNSITEQELAAKGVKICIYANQLLRAAYPSMMNVAETILASGRSKEVDDDLMSVKKILTLIDDNTGKK
jgi:phosphoenolpyruvate mutase